MGQLKDDLSKMLEKMKSSSDADSASQAQEILTYVKKHRSERAPQEEAVRPDSPDEVNSE